MNTNTKISTGNQTAAIATMVMSVMLPVVVTIVDVVATHGINEDVQVAPESHITESECSGPDLVITSVRPNAIREGDNISCTVFIKNIGDAPANLDYPRIAGWQAFISTNGVAKDIRVNGKNFSGTLDIGKTTSATAAVPASLITNPHYLIVELYVLSSVGECNSNNNTFVFESRSQ